MLPFNTFSIHDLAGFMTMAFIFVAVCLFFWKLERRGVDLVFAALAACSSAACLAAFLGRQPRLRRGRRSGGLRRRGAEPRAHPRVLHRGHDRPAAGGPLRPAILRQPIVPQPAHLPGLRGADRGPAGRVVAAVHGPAGRAVSGHQQLVLAHALAAADRPAGAGVCTCGG